ncbi:hypothetical protein JCM8097_003816 [Rhodosporidiobolus ruineniae]
MSSTSPAQAGPSSAAAASTGAAGGGGGEAGGGGGEGAGASAVPAGEGSQDPPVRLQCTVEGCTKKFGKLSHLTRHIKTHDETFPYHCSVCDKGFKRRDVCTRHENTIHKDKTADAIQNGFNDTELDLLEIFGTGSSTGQGAAPAPPPRSGHATPAIDWLKLLGAVEPEGTAAAGGISASAGPAGGAGGVVELPFPASTSGGSGVVGTSSASQQPARAAFPISASPAPSPATAAAALGSVEADSLATPSDGGGPEAPSHNPWPHVYEPIAASADPLSLPSVSNPPPLLMFEQPSNAVSPETRQAMMDFVSDSHRSPWWAVSLASFPSASILSSCIGLYISRFHDSFPILDPVTLGEGKSSPILLLACAAVGAMYRPEFEGLGVALTEVVRRTVLWKRERDPRSSFEVSVIQAWFLSSISGLFCGSRKLYQHAEIARAGLATAARRMNLLRESTSFVQDLLVRTTPSAEELRAAQMEDELRLRLGWGVYIFDNLVAVLFNLQPVVSIAEVAETTYLPEDSLLPTPSSERRRFRKSLALLLTEGRVDGFLPPFATTILQFTLYRLCLDASYCDTILSSVLDVQRTGPYRLVFPPDFRQNPQEVLDRIGSAWHASASAITPLHVQTTALSYHATLHFSCPDFLSLSKVCAGKYGSERAMGAREAVTRLAVTQPVAVRRVLVRAVQLGALLERHRYDTPAEVVWMADAAMAVWAIVKFARSALSAPSPLATRSVIHWSNLHGIEPRIQHGGPLALRNGLGDFDTVTPEAVLEKFAEGLEDLPWGLAKKYRAVLLQLCVPE